MWRWLWSGRSQTAFHLGTCRSEVGFYSYLPALPAVVFGLPRTSNSGQNLTPLKPMGRWDHIESVTLRDWHSCSKNLRDVFEWLLTIFLRVKEWDRKFTEQNGRATGIEFVLPTWEAECSILYFQHLQNYSEKLCVHTLHPVHALPDLRVTVGVCGTVCHRMPPESCQRFIQTMRWNSSVRWNKDLGLIFV